jgi:putative chitinase
MDLALVLKAICPRMLVGQQLLLALNEAFRKGDINTDLRQAAFLARAAHETMEFKVFREVWGPTPQQLRYEGTTLALRLGNTEPGDGLRFRGRGIFQLTGRTNYRNYGFMLGLPFEQHPELLDDLVIGGQVAGLYWKAPHKDAPEGLNPLADKRDLARIVLAINGGLNGYEPTQVYYARALSAMRLVT